MSFQFKRGSPSDDALLTVEPFLWLLKNADIFGHPNWKYTPKFGPAASRGNSVELAVPMRILHGATLDEATYKCRQDFLQRIKKESAEYCDEKELREYDNIEYFINQLYIAIDSDDFKKLGLGKLISTQTAHKADIPTPHGPRGCLGYTDFKHQKKGKVKKQYKVGRANSNAKKYAYWDLKTTNSNRLEFNENHQTQLGFYADVSGCEQHIVYVRPSTGLTPGGKKSTAKGFAIHTLTDEQRIRAKSKRHARAALAMRLYSMGWDAAMAVSMPKDTSSFYWDDQARKFAKDIWGLV